MKKQLFTTVALALCSLMPSWGISNCYSADIISCVYYAKLKRLDCQDSVPKIGARSLVSCTYLQGANQLVFNFEENLGDVTIFVTTNLPGIQYMEFADSSHETYVLELFDHSDTYYITVEASTGELYSAELSVTAPTHLVVVTHDTTGNIVLKEVQAINQ